MLVFMFAGMFIIPQACICFWGHIPFVMVLFFAICGGYVGALTFSIIQRADIFLPSGLFNNDYKNCHVKAQSVAAGEKVYPGTVITIEFIYEESIE